MDIPAAMYDDACTEDANCANMLGLHTLGECRNGVCSTLPAVAENNHCDYGYECDEGLECNNGSCMTPLPLSGALDSACDLNTVCQEGLGCFAGFCLSSEVIQIIGGDCTDSNECGS